MRHGEVHNPSGVLYGRMPGFRLSERGHAMAQLAADHLAASGRKIGHLYASPLLRAQQSAEPISEMSGREILVESRIIEPTNKFEGQKKVGFTSALKDVRNWPKLWNPLLPSWGEPYARIARRVLAAMEDAWQAAENASDTGDIVFVTHQAVVWAAHRKINRLPLMHNPANRRCELSSITSFAVVDDAWQEVGYVSPAAGLLAEAQDNGAV